jgi:deoxyribose-phosphate aldolase
MRATVGADMGIKASGGIRSIEDVQKMVSAGATRIGASASVKIVEQACGGPPSASEPTQPVAAKSY